MELNGILSMPAEQYRSADGVSKSSLDWIAPPYTPAHFRARFITGELKDQETEAKRMGTLTHRVILEPDTLHGAFYVEPDTLAINPLRLAKLKSARRIGEEDGMAIVKWNSAFTEAEDWCRQHSDRPILAAAEAKAIKAMRDAVWRHPLAKRLLTGAAHEQNLFATDKQGLLRKGRLDVLKTGYPIADLKVVAQVDEGWFEKQNENCRWYVQGAYYTDLAELLGIDCLREFACIAVEKTPPYDVVCYDFSDLLQAGRMCYQRDLALLRHCRDTDEWPGRSNAFVPAGLPAWAMKQLEALG